MTIEPFRARGDEPSFRRDYALPPGNSFLRTLTARAVASIRRIPAVQVAAEMWPSDKLVAQILTRAATSPAMTTVTGWAAELAQRVVADGLEALGPASAGAEVMKRSLVLTFDGAGSISAPGLPLDFSGVSAFVAEGQPIRVYDGALTPALLNPYKLAAIVVLTREMLESSNAEKLIGDSMVIAAGRSLDEVLFDANPASAARPAGLRNGIAVLTASNSTDAWEAAFEDVSNLIGAVAPVGGRGPYILVASPGRAVGMGMRFEGNDNFVVLASAAVGNDLYAIAPTALVAALSPEPEIETSKGGTLHMEKTTPLPVGTAAPHRSLFQTDSIALKIRWPVSWVLRDPRGFAWVTPSWK